LWLWMSVGGQAVVPATGLMIVLVVVRRFEELTCCAIVNRVFV
jgi:hypothetical protein